MADFRLYLALSSRIGSPPKTSSTVAAIASTQRSVARGRLVAAVARTILCLIIHPFFEDDKMETFEMSVSGFSRLTYTIQLTVGVTVVNKNVDMRALLVFQRLQRFYNTFNILAALISGLAIATLTLNEFHPCTTSMAGSAEAFLCSSAMCAVDDAFVPLRRPRDRYTQRPGDRLVSVRSS